MDFEQILTLVITVVLVPLLTWAVKAFINFLDAKIAQVKNETIRKALNDAKEELAIAVNTAVNETAQTFVDGLKKDGAFTAEMQKQAFDKSVIRTKEIMSNAGMDIIETATGALNQLITAQIEATIKQRKNW